jgi:GNAT superfamily N-acetyltransferase
VSLVVRELTKNDLVASEDIIRSAYAMRPGQNTGLERYLSLQPDGWLLVEARGVPVALGGAMYYGTFGYIGLMSVLPGMQHQGIGRLLMERLLAWLYAHDCATILLDASAAGVPLYLSMGFTVDDSVMEMCCHNDHGLSGSRQPWLPDGGSLLVMKETDIPDLVAFDSPYFGAPRPAIFASYLDDCQQRAFVVHDEAGRITGYLFVQAGGRLGPWVADTSDDAEKLFMYALQLPVVGHEYSVQVPSANNEAHQLLLRYGFQQRRMLQHMRLGDPVQNRDRTKLYGQASFGLG